MNRLILTIILVLGLSFQALSENLIEKGMKAYRSGNYAGAVALFDSVARSQGGSAPLLFDLANAYYHVGDFGNARLYLERAKKLDPSNDAIAGNLKYIESKVEDANNAELKGKKVSLSPDQESFFESIRRTVTEDSSSNFWAILSVSAFLFMIASLSIYIFTRNVAARKVGFFGSLIFIFFSVCFMIFSLMAARQAEETDEGVVVAYKVSLKAEPEENASSSSAVLTRGTKLRILSEEADVAGNVSWFKVRLNNDNVGWIPAREFRQI